MKIRQLPSGAWTTQVQVNGVRRSFTHKSKTELRKMAEAYRQNASDVPHAPLGVLIDNYIASKRNVLSPSTVARYEQIRRLDFQRLMTVPTNEITSERMQTEINLMAATHSPKSVRNAYGLISAAVNQASGRRFNVTLPKSRKIEYSVPTTDDVLALCEAAGDNLRTAIMLAAFCGLRRGEIAALEDSDISGNMIHINKSYVYDDNRRIVSKSPKTYSSDRYVTAPDVVIQQINGKSGRVCPISLNSITRRFTELRDKLGMSCRFHDLRHYYASALHAIGVKDQYIMKFGGWKSTHVLNAVYRDTLDDFELRAADQAASFFDQSANKMQTDTR